MVRPIAGELVYADSSALVKLVVEEPESRALEAHLRTRERLATSRLAMVEATRAAVMANPASGFEEASRLFETCELVDVDADVVERARRLVDTRLRALDAIQLASALVVGTEEFIAYDRRLLEAAGRAGLRTVSPGA